MFILKIAAVMFVAEFLTMQVIAQAGLADDFVRALTDSTILTVLASAVIYVWVVRPYVRARDAAERSLGASEERWRFALEAAGAGVWELDALTGELYCSPRSRQILGFGDDDVDCTMDEWRRRIDPEQLPGVQAQWLDYLEGRSPAYRVEHRMRAHDGGWRWVLCRALAVSRADDSKPLRIIGTHADITEHKRVQDELRSLATTDSLTELSNRRHFLDRLEQAWSLRQRQSEQPVAVLMIDIDHFKQVNDTHGHAVGDAALKHFASLLVRHLRKADAVGRLGGEEFGIVLLGASPASAHAFAERLRAAVESTPLRHAGLVVPMTVSIGVAALRDDDVGGVAALIRADAAMYAAKQAGRNRVRLAADEAAHERRRGFVKLVWREAYECGVEPIDREHRQLFDTANRLLNAIVDGSPGQHVNALVRSLIADVAAHFRAEEALLRGSGYAGLEQHRAHHDALLARANAVAERHAHGEAEIGELFGFIAYEIVARHLLSEDRKFFDALGSHRESAAETA